MESFVCGYLENIIVEKKKKLSLPAFQESLFKNKFVFTAHGLKRTEPPEPHLEPPLYLEPPEPHEISFHEDVK